MKKILTIILDGFGYREETEGNAIKAANMATFNGLWNDYPHALLGASEEAVGLHKGQMGNSEVGHMTIGAGRLVRQNEIIVDDFFKNQEFDNKNVNYLLTLKEKDVHIMGLASDGNIHAGIDDFINMYNFLVDNGFTKIHFHLITDGRDTGIYEAYKYINSIREEIKKRKVGDIATICGRYYAMDREHHWDRTKIYYDLITKGKGTYSIDIENSLKENYASGVSDEFMLPILTSNNVIKNGDVLIWMNYRADRARQILDTIVNCNEFSEFPVLDLSQVEVFSFFEVEKNIKTKEIIPHERLKNTLGMYLSELGWTQARIAESEKYPHVTFFFDGLYDGKIDKCDKFHIPSPDVPTYDLKPEMSCVEVTKKTLQAMMSDYDFILVNFANPDMVGHTGNMEAATKACMAIDICLNKIMEKAEENFYKVVILADHGNADTMINPDGTPCTTHTTALVPFIICDKKIKLIDSGTLCNVAPTILDYMDIAIPKEMEATGSLIIEE